MESQHPRPWKIDSRRPCNIAIVDANGMLVVVFNYEDFGVSELDARFDEIAAILLAAVNNHDRRVDALTMIANETLSNRRDGAKFDRINTLARNALSHR